MNDIESFVRQYVDIMCANNKVITTRSQINLKTLVLGGVDKYQVKVGGWYTDEEMKEMYGRDQVFTTVYAFARDNSDLFIK